MLLLCKRDVIVPTPFYLVRCGIVIEPIAHIESPNLANIVHDLIIADIETNVTVYATHICMHM